METEASVDQLKKGENLSQEVNKILVENRDVLEAKDDVELPSASMVPANGGAFLGPITPYLNRENGDFLFDCKSQLTLVPLPPQALGFDSHRNHDLCSSDEDSPRTPREGVFDPFAPGPDELMLAPQRRKRLEESRSYVARQLNFNSSVEFVGDGKCESDAETISDEEMLLETVYETLLDAIVSKQTETLLAEISPLDSTRSHDGFMTPTSSAPLSGIAETCPGAPVKPPRKLWNIDQGLCRKLEF